MGKVVIDMSMSLDGYIAAPNDVPGNGLGDEGMRLHNWMFDDPSVFDRVFGELTETTGAVVMGRRTYDNSISEWGDKGPLGEVPCFVVTRHPPDEAPSAFTFVPEGIQRANELAHAAAGDKTIGVMGADVPRQFLGAGLVDEIRIHVVNVLLGSGRRMFEELPDRIDLDQVDVGEDAGVAHITYRVTR